MKDRDITPQRVKEYADAAIRQATDPRERETLLKLKQHSWDLAVCVQRLNEALGVNTDGRQETDRRSG